MFIAADGGFVCKKHWESAVKQWWLTQGFLNDERQKVKTKACPAHQNSQRQDGSTQFSAELMLITLFSFAETEATGSTV